MKLEEIADVIVWARKLRKHKRIYAEVYNYDKPDKILHHATYITSGYNIAEQIKSTPWLDKDMDFDVETCSPEIHNRLLKRMANVADITKPLVGEAYHLAEEKFGPVHEMMKNHEKWGWLYRVYSATGDFLMEQTGAKNMLEYAAGKHPVELIHIGTKKDNIGRRSYRGNHDVIYLFPRTNEIQEPKRLSRK